MSFGQLVQLFSSENLTLAKVLFPHFHQAYGEANVHPQMTSKWKRGLPSSHPKSRPFAHPMRILKCVSITSLSHCILVPAGALRSLLIGVHRYDALTWRVAVSHRAIIHSENT